MDDATFTSDTAAMNRRSLLEQLAIIRSLFRKESSANGDAAATAAARNRNVVECRAREGVRLINDQMAAVSTELLFTVMSDMMLLRLLDGLGLEEGRAVPSSNAASDQQLMLMDDDVAAAATAKKMKRAAAAAAKKKRNKRNKAAAKHKNKKIELMSWKGGGLISLIMMIAFGSITTLIFPLSLIHPSDGSGEGNTPPALPPSASKSLRQSDHRSNYDESDSSVTDIISPLPAVAVVSPPIFSPIFVGNRRSRVKSNELRADSTCLDTPNWKDKNGMGCGWYERYFDLGCPNTEQYTGDMGPVAYHCCFCGGGSGDLYPTMNPTMYPTFEPTFEPTMYPVGLIFAPTFEPTFEPTMYPSSSPTISANPTSICFDTPAFKDRRGHDCDWYERSGVCQSDRLDDDGIIYAELVGDMGPSSEHCCICGGGGIFTTCEDFRSKCQESINIGFGFEDGVVAPLCKEAESCSCEGEDDFKIVPNAYGLSREQTVGLYNECKCDFWLPLCEDEGGEACDYAAEYCCGDYSDVYNTWEFRIGEYLNSPACYCDFFNYAQNEFGHMWTPKAMNINKEFENPCGQGIWLSDSEDERSSLEAIYNKTDGQNWKNNAGWMSGTVWACQWYGISCDNEGRVTGIDLRDNNLVGQYPVYTRNGTDYYTENEWKDSKYGLANLYSLETLDLANNRLTGTIEYPPLYNLHSITHFDVSGNLLSGEVNVLVAPSLKHADFSNNHFTSMHRFEKYKPSFQTLSFCDVSNNLIEKDVTYLLENIPPNIQQLIASNNEIHGSLPEWLNNLPALLRHVSVLSGELPDFAESILSLQELDLSNQNQTNGFTGSIPEDLSKFQSLKILNLAGNKLTGAIPPAIGNMAVLEVFDLSENSLDSSIPAELGMLAGTLKRLDLANNTLSGTIPSELGQLQGASILLEGNLFHDSSTTAPLSLCMLSSGSVKEFDLANDVTLCPVERNALSDFYDSAKGVEWTDGSLWLNEYASYCNWTGVTCNDMNNVTKLNLTNNGLSGRLSESIGILTFIEVLDLSDNDIKGSIPKEIGKLFNLKYLRLSYNAFTGTAPEGLGELKQLQLLQVQTNRITKIPNIPQLDESIYNNSTFVTDCGVPTAFDEALQCEHCTMCCNANEDCYPQEETRIAEHLDLSYIEFAAVLIACFIAFCCVVVFCLYLLSKRKNRENAVTKSTERRLEDDDKYALSRIGNASVYSYFVTDKVLGWIVAFATLGIQVGILVFFVMASEANLQDDAIDIQFTWKCPRDSVVCKDTADLTDAGWFIFSMLMIAHLAKDLISGSKLIYHSSKVRHPLGSRIRYFIGGTLLCSITLFALYVSTIYNMAIATSNTDIIVNSVIVLFVMDLDEWIFAALEACKEKWTAHAADSEDSSSDTKAEKGGVIDEMKDKIALQDAQIADQQKELMRQKIQIEQMARRSGELTELQEAVQNMQDSLAGSSASFETETIFYCAPNPNANESSTSHADAVESEDAKLDADADTKEGGKMTMNGTKMRNHYRRIKLGIRRGRPSTSNIQRKRQRLQPSLTLKPSLNVRVTRVTQ